MHKYIRLNMSTGKARVLPLAPELALEGGRGFAARVLCSDMNPAAPALGPENVLVFSAGLLAGLDAPCFSHLTVGAKGPLSQIFTAEALPGTAGRLLARLGYRAIVVTGQPRLAVSHVLVVSEPLVELREAAPDADLDTTLRREFGDAAAILAPHAPAPDAVADIRLTSPVQCLHDAAPNASEADHCAAACGGPGLGAVMNAKGLAAVVLCPDGVRKGAERGRLREGLEQFRRLLRQTHSPCAAAPSPPCTAEAVALHCLGVCPQAHATPTPELFAALGELLTGLYGGAWSETRILELGRETLAREKAFDSWAGPAPEQEQAPKPLYAQDPAAKAV